MENELAKNLTASNHKFSMDLYRVLATNDENVFFSPFSLYVALTLVFLGSKGETAQELREHLALPQKKEHLEGSIRQLLNNLENPELNTATEMFVEQTYRVRASFKEDAKKYVNSDSQLVDFRTAPDQAAKLINSWVSSQTNNTINNLIPPGELDESTRLVLVNAIHFKDKWLTAFKAADTRKKRFFTSTNNFKEVDMMHLTNTFRYKEENKFKVLELPYQNKNFKLIIFLPNEIDGLPALEQELPNLNFANILNGMEEKKVRLSLPKFKLEKFFNLNGALRKLGIDIIFDESKADFTGIYEPAEFPLVVSKVLHKAFIEVNEIGTKASAATAVEFRARSFSPDRDIIPKFTVNHPFTFAILFNDVTLFIGRQLSIN